MPRRATSIRTNRAEKKKHTRNLKVRQQLKKALKKFHGLILEKKAAEAKELLGKLFSQLDKAAKKNIIHPKTASRKKSRLAKSINRAA
ncbi:MAG: 30S ribosomal protein S20 [Candidatus Omnitrophota bacterium]